MRHALALLIVVVCMGAVSHGQSLPNPFDVGLGVRAMGFGGAGTAWATGTEALLYNPAALGWSQGAAADSTLSSALGLYSVTWLAGSIPSLAAGIGYLGVGGITDPAGDPLAFSHLAAVVGTGFDLSRLRMFPFPAAGGISVKYNRVQVADRSGSGLAFDLGLLARVNTSVGRLQVGLVLREFGFGPGLGETAEGWSTELATGVALVSPVGLVLAFDLTSEYTALGLGWDFLGLLQVRAGLRLHAGAQWALGFGFRWSMFVLDYALLTHPVLSASHRFGFGVHF